MGLCGGSCASRWSRPLVPPPVSSTRGQCGQGAPWVLYPAHFTLQAPGRGRDNPPSRKAPCRVSGILVSGVVRLFPPWGFRGGVGEAEAGSVGLLSSPASSLLGTFSGFLFCQIDVVLSCSPGPGLSRVRRGTDVHGEWDRSSRSARGPLAPSPLPAVAVRWGVWGGVQAPARPRPPVFCLTALAGPGSPDAADTLACLPWLRVVRGPPRHGEGRPGAALLTRLGVLSALRVALRGAPGALQVVSGARNRAGSVVSRSQRPPPSGHRCRWRVRGAGGGVGKGGPPRPPRGTRAPRRRLPQAVLVVGIGLWCGACEPLAAGRASAMALGQPRGCCLFARHAVPVSVCRCLARGARLPVVGDVSMACVAGRRRSPSGVPAASAQDCPVCLSPYRVNPPPAPRSPWLCKAFGTPFRGARPGGGDDLGGGDAPSVRKPSLAIREGALGYRNPPAAAPPLRV